MTHDTNLGQFAVNVVEVNRELDMRIYDALPRELREMLANGRFDFSAAQTAKLWRKNGNSISAVKRAHAWTEKYEMEALKKELAKKQDRRSFREKLSAIKGAK